MKIYTKFGDKMQTSINTGVVYKDNILVSLIGELDELISFVTTSYVLASNGEVKETLEGIIKDLMDLSAFIGNYSKEEISTEKIKQIETKIDYFQSQLPIVKKFLVLGKKNNSTFLNVSRTICRRFERSLVSYLRNTNLSMPQVLIYINRLSDLLYIMTRVEDELELSYDY